MKGSDLTFASLERDFGETIDNSVKMTVQCSALNNNNKTANVRNYWQSNREQNGVHYAFI